MIRLLTPLGVVLFLALLSGCGPSDESDPTLEPHQDLNDALAAYLSVDEPVGGDWESFYQEGEQLLGQLRSAHTEFAAATEEAINSGIGDAGPRRSYVKLLDDWIDSQEQQLAASRSCMDSTQPSACFSEILADAGMEMPRQDRAEMQQLSQRLYGK